MSRPVGGGLKERIDAVEAAYEFMLAYAAQGVTGEEASSWPAGGSTSAATAASAAKQSEAGSQRAEAS